MVHLLVKLRQSQQHVNLELSGLFYSQQWVDLLNYLRGNLLMDIQISKTAAKHILAFIHLAEDPKALKEVLMDFLKEERKVQVDGLKLADVKRMQQNVIAERTRLNTDATAEGKLIMEDAKAIKRAADTLMEQATHTREIVTKDQDRVKVLLANAENKEKRATALQQEVEEMRNSWAEQEKAAKMSRQAADVLKADYEVKLGRIRAITNPPLHEIAKEAV